MQAYLVQCVQGVSSKKTRNLSGTARDKFKMSSLARYERATGNAADATANAVPSGCHSLFYPCITLVDAKGQKGKGGR
jgi:hypothetical protein